MYVLGSVLGSVFFFIALYYVVRAAVLNASLAQYKAIRWYEKTGEWDHRFGHLKPPVDPEPEVHS